MIDLFGKKITSIINIHKKNGKRPEFDKYVGRAVNETEFTKNSKWFKPRNMILSNYEPHIKDLIKKDPIKYNLKELEGNKLACWCITTTKIYPIICHAQILLKLIKEMRK